MSLPVEWEERYVPYGGLQPARSADATKWQRLISILEYMRDNPAKYSTNADQTHDAGFVEGMSQAILQVRIEAHIDEFGHPPHWAMGGDAIMLDDEEEISYPEGLEEAERRFNEEKIDGSETDESEGR